MPISQMQEQEVKELEQRLEILNQKLHLLKELRNCQGYPLFSELIAQTVRNLKHDLLDGDDHGLDGVIALSQKKEYLSGLVHASKLVEIHAEAYEQEREEILENLRRIEDEYSDETFNG